MPADAPVTIQLTRAEAVVLFEFLARYGHDHRLVVEDQAEEVALWNTLCALERALTEPLANDYKAILRRAKEVLKSGEDKGGDARVCR